MKYMWTILVTMVAVFVTHNPVASVIGFIVYMVLAANEKENENENSGNTPEPTEEKKDA